MCKITLWDANNLSYLESFDPFHQEAYAIAFSPDGKHIVTGHEFGVINIWNSSPGEHKKHKKGHTIYALSLK
jgi:WD40 repeat protein